MRKLAAVFFVLLLLISGFSYLMFRADHSTAIITGCFAPLPQAIPQAGPIRKEIWIDIDTLITHRLDQLIVELRTTGLPNGTGIPAPDMGYAYILQYLTEGRSFEPGVDIDLLVGITRLVSGCTDSEESINSYWEKTWSDEISTRQEAGELSEDDSTILRQLTPQVWRMDITYRL